MQRQSPKRPRLEEQTQNVPAANPFLRCAHLILPWLTPQELAAISLTCKTLTLISKSVTLRRSLDASRSLENLPVPFCNAVDGHPYLYFVYSPSQVLASSSPSPRQRWGSAPNRVPDSPCRLGSLSASGSAGVYSGESDGTVRDLVSRVGPDVGRGFAGLPGTGSDWVSRLGDVQMTTEDDSGPGTDLTSRNEPNSENGSGRSPDSGPGGVLVSLVDESGELVSGCGCEWCDDADCPCLALEGLEISNECGSGCGCGSDCPNRVTQKGVSVRLKIVRDEKKGWCLYADQIIKQGQFICEYTGELLTTEEAQRRQKIYDKLISSGKTRIFSSALLVIREHLPSGKACLRINIDATRIGNIARFINHSCDGGNLSSVLLRSSGTLLPRLCFFASRDIQPDEELTFSYGDVRVRASGLKCFCGSSCCFGTLPSENT